MAEKKIGDMVYVVIYLLLALGALSTLIIGFDEQYTNSDNIGGDIQGLYNSSSDDYYSSEVQVQDDTFNTSSFSITTGSDVDVRGTSQSILMARNSPSIMSDFANNLGGVIMIHPIISLFFGSMIIVTGVILFLRFIRPGGA